MELYRNMALAFGCVLVLTLLLIADIGACILVSICVLSTLVKIIHFIYFIIGMHLSHHGLHESVYCCCRLRWQVLCISGA